MKKILGLLTIATMLVSCKKEIDNTREGAEKLNTDNSIELVSKTVRDTVTGKIDVYITSKVYDNKSIIQADTIKISQISDKPIYFTVTEELGVSNTKTDSLK